MPDRMIVYVDGFNLYNGMLDLPALAQSLSPSDWIISKEPGVTYAVPPAEIHEAVTRTQAAQVASWNVLTPFIPPVKRVRSQDDHASCNK